MVPVKEAMINKTLHRLDIMDSPPYNTADVPVEIFSEIRSTENPAHLMVRIPSLAWESLGKPESIDIQISTSET